MRYISTRDNHEPAASATAIGLGMVPSGGLFVPETVPRVEMPKLHRASYHETAEKVLAPLLSDFGEAELQDCIARAYTAETFDVDSVVELAALGERRYAMELWHGPTAAFKDVALQIMPYFMSVAKAKTGETANTLILVATSGDTGKAALEGFKDRPGISIVVFYPHEGVSEIQKLQMVTTDGDNTHVAALRGNFDDCQAGVKGLFGDAAFRERLAKHNYMLSSANSINWGRLCPQIVYYYHAYGRLCGRGVVRAGEPVDFCVPTGNFGNILAAYYARRMGLPIRRLICASNRNRILADFLTTGVYDVNREFYRTVSPAMDILVSSNLERFLFEITGHDAGRIRGWYGSLAGTGRFEVDEEVRRAMADVMTPGWVDEPEVFEAIGQVYREHRYLIDTHTAVGVAVSGRMASDRVPLVVDATASPYKFSNSVLTAVGGDRVEDEVTSIERLHELTGAPVHRALKGLGDRPLRHSRVTDARGMEAAVLDMVGIGA